MHSAITFLTMTAQGSLLKMHQEGKGSAQCAVIALNPKSYT